MKTTVISGSPVLVCLTPENMTETRAIEMILKHGVHGFQDGSFDNKNKPIPGLTIMVKARIRNADGVTVSNWVDEKP